MPWLAEDITVNELPPSFLGSFFRCSQLVVLGDIAVQCPEEDHCHHSRQEEHDHERVQDGEPVDLPSSHLEVIIPTRRPTNRAFAPLYIVCVDDLVVLAEVKDGISGFILTRCCDRRWVLGAHLCSLRHAVRLHLKTDDAVPLILIRIHVVLQVQSDVVVDVVSAIPLDANRETVHVRHPSTGPTSSDITRGRWQVVHEPVH
mmetsp:Transcript_100495/g.279898  ORF Transcript_100495/g.279898 Transcript_100495/m.279898 type:complete len:202 (-) Transcript_100495:442-1047(-)